MSARLLLWVWLLALLTLLACDAQPREPPEKKRRVKAATSSRIDEVQQRKDHSNNNIVQEVHVNAAAAATAETPDTFAVPVVEEKFTCPKCLVTENVLSYVLDMYWSENYISAYGCACYLYKSNKENGILQSILHSLSKMTELRNKNDVNYDSGIEYAVTAQFDVPTVDPPQILTRWDIIGPFPVGKLEVDGDPLFTAFNDHDERDIGSYILTLPRNITFYSELIQDSVLNWYTTNAPSSGLVDVRFPVHWNELAQGLSSMAVLEFQGWAKSISYVKLDGSYIVSCKGVHTVYVRNDGMTRILVGDIYSTDIIHGIVELYSGLVAIIIPLRGSAHSSFTCKITPQASPKTSLIVHSVLHIPDSLELSDARGLLLSTIFTVCIQNIQAYPLNINLNIDPPSSSECSYSIYKALPSINTEYTNHEITLAPGQTTILPLEITPLCKDKTILPTVTCRSGHPFVITIIPSRGEHIKFLLEFPCRKANESLVVSYLDYDLSVAQAGILLPLPTHPNTINKNRQINYYSQKSYINNTYPFLLSLHGTGISPRSQADAYKYIPSSALLKKGHYTYGIESFYLIAPSRHGAHNWEGIGEMSAKQSIQALHDMTTKYPTILPQISTSNGVISGHSMGGHGAWIMAVNNPDLSVCVASLSSWIKKEEYSVANNFFVFDVQNSYVDPKLKYILELSLSEFHVDKVLANMATNERIHIRVGGQDLTTHPYYSRKMHRLLATVVKKSNNQQPDITYDEVSGKQHWWWDTLQENDGGVLNDESMRTYYAKCYETHKKYYANVTQIVSKAESVKMIGVNNFNNSKCILTDTLTINVVHPSSHSGHCGIRVMQLKNDYRLSVVTMRCDGHIFANKSCVISTDGNIEMLLLKPYALNRNSILYGVMELVVDTIPFDVRRQDEPIYICWRLDPYDCSNTLLYPLQVKLPFNNGPMRHIYSKPLLIVYGTPRDRVLRLTIKDLAVYLGNMHVSAHHSNTRVMSDLEYKAARYHMNSNVANVIFVGGPPMNKAMLQLCHYNHNHTRNPTQHCFSPVHFETNAQDVIDGKEGVDSHFSIGKYNYTSKDDAIIYTLPIATAGDEKGNYKKLKDYDENSIGMGICIHASSSAGYLHISRLAWSVVPPMVRSPFANYFPDFMVVNSNIWSRGFDGVESAGYWNNQWTYDPYLTYNKKA